MPELAARVLPVGSYIIATEVLDPDRGPVGRPTGRMMVDTKNFLFYWRLTPDGRMAFGGRRSLDPVDVPEARDFLFDAMVRIHPQLGEVAVKYAWGGNVAVTLDRLPHVGPSTAPGTPPAATARASPSTPGSAHPLAEAMWGGRPRRPSPSSPPDDPAAGRGAAYLPLAGAWYAAQDRGRRP